jgi:RNase H-fold protein (predicted Holliday junction resolvase)
MGRADRPAHFLWDERPPTREAHRILYELGHARQAHRKVVDQVAALILQSFPDEKQGSVNSGQSFGRLPATVA